MEPRAPAGAPPPLRFALTIVDGRARLVGQAGPLPLLGRVDRLALEVPGLRFPFDLTPGARAFRERRCELLEFAFSCAASEIEALLGRASLGRFGLSAPAFVLTPRGARLALRASIAGHTAEISAKVAITTTAAAAWRLSLHDVRVHGFVPVPAPLLLAALPAALGLAGDGSGARHWAMQPPALVRPRGLTELDLEAGHLALVALLANAGWRLPARERVVSKPVELGAGRLAFAVAAGEDDVVEPVAPGDAGAPDPGLAALAEAALHAGEVRPATEGFRRALVAQPDNEFARERLYQLLAASSDGLTELEQRAGERLEARPHDALALVASAVVAGARGRATEAARLYTRVAAHAEAADEVLDEAAARLGAARELARAGEDAAARAALARALVLRPDHPAAHEPLGDANGDGGGGTGDPEPRGA